MLTRSVLVLGQDFIQGIDRTTIYAEKMYSPNFIANDVTFCLSLHYNGDNSYLFVNGKEFINFKAKDSEVLSYPVCLGKILRDLNETKTYPGLTGYVYHFSVDYSVITNDKILGIHKYLMEKNNKV